MISKFKDISIKNHSCYFFDIKKFDPNNIEIGQ